MCGGLAPETGHGWRGGKNGGGGPPPPPPNSRPPCPPSKLMASMLRHFDVVAVTAGAARAVAITPAFAAALVAIAVAVDLSHHGRRAGFELLDPHRHGAQRIFIDVPLPYDLATRCRR